MDGRMVGRTDWWSLRGRGWATSVVERGWATSVVLAERMDLDTLTETY